MDWFTAALLTAAVLAVAGGFLSLFEFDSQRPFSPSRFDLAAMATLFVVLLGLNTLFFGRWQPVFHAGGWFAWAFFNLLVTGLVTWGYDAWEGGKSFHFNAPNFATVISFLVIVGLFIGTAFTGPVWIAPLGQENATKLANLVRVATEDEIKAAQAGGNNLSLDEDAVVQDDEKIDLTQYPDTDQNHIPVVTLSAAREKAERLMSGPRGDRYKIRKGELQVRSGELVYIFDIVPDGFFDHRWVKGIVKEYIIVSAENSAETATLSKPLEINYYPGGWFSHNLERLVWSKMFAKDHFVDDLSAEVDDQGNLFYTGSLNQTDVRWQVAVPKKAFTVNAVTGEYKEYDLPTATQPGNLPAWVDRVYSASVSKKMLEWYGLWGAGPELAPYRVNNTAKSSANRIKVAGEPNLVFTNTGPAWQFIMAPYNSDLDKRKTASQIILMDTRTGTIRIYEQEGVQIESALIDHFKTNQTAQANDGKTVMVPDKAGLYRINGRLVWVGGLVPEDKLDSTDSVSFGGVGMLDAEKGNATGAIIAPTKGAALDKLSLWYANADQNEDPSSDSSLKTVEGVIADKYQLVENGNTRVVITIIGQDAVFSGVVTYGNRKTIPRLLAKIGDTVSITYRDSGSSYVEIQSLSIVKVASPEPATPTPQPTPQPSPVG